MPVMMKFILISRNTLDCEDKINIKIQAPPPLTVPYPQFSLASRNFSACNAAICSETSDCISSVFTSHDAYGYPFLAYEFTSAAVACFTNLANASPFSASAASTSVKSLRYRSKDREPNTFATVDVSGTIFGQDSLLLLQYLQQSETQTVQDPGMEMGKKKRKKFEIG